MHGSRPTPRPMITEQVRPSGISEIFPRTAVCNLCQWSMEQWNVERRGSLSTKDPHFFLLDSNPGTWCDYSEESLKLWWCLFWILCYLQTDRRILPNVTTVPQWWIHEALGSRCPFWCRKRTYFRKFKGVTTTPLSSRQAHTSRVGPT